MQIVIVMAGVGERFIRGGHTVPKPLVLIDGKPMIERVINTFPGENDFVFICNSKHLETSNLREVLSSLRPESKIVSVVAKKLGPAESIVQAQEYIDDSKPTIVSYCDQGVVWNYDDFKRTMNETDVDTSALCYKDFHPHLLGPNLYAGVRLGSDGLVAEVREKHSFTANKMDTWQQAGVFYFKKGALVKKYSQQVIDRNIKANGEHFISLLFNPMLDDELKASVYPVKFFCQWGTPEDVAEFEFWRTNPGTEEARAFYGKRGIDRTGIEIAEIMEYWQNYLKDR